MRAYRVATVRALACHLAVRIAIVFVLAACSAAPPPPSTVLEARAPELAQTCDLAAWQQRATSPGRARIAGREVIVVRHGDGRSEVLAWIGRDLLVGANVSDDRLDRVVTHETAVAREPGGPWLTGVFAEPGLATTGSGDWLAVQADPPFEVTGFVPRAATGTRWVHDVPADGSAPVPRHSLEGHTEVLAAPAFGAEQVAAIMGGYEVVDRQEDGPPGWQRIEAHAPGIRVTGWAEVRRPSPLHGVYDFSDDTIEGDLVRPDGVSAPPHARPGCVRARARDDAPIVGVVTGTITGRRFAAGWLEGRVDAPWGRVDGYVRDAPSTAAPRL